jgi:hypothetical protein
MARISKIAELHARKQALITQSEIYRENLLAELDHLKSHADGLARKVHTIRRVSPWFMAAVPILLPVVGLLVGKRFKISQIRQYVRPKESKGTLAKALVVLRLFSKYGPLVRTFANRLRTRHNSEPRQERRKTHT